MKSAALIATKNASDQLDVPANVTVRQNEEIALWSVGPLDFDRTRVSCHPEASGRGHASCKRLPDEQHPCLSLLGSSPQNHIATSLLRDLEEC